MAVHHSVEMLPNGMPIPHYYVLWRGLWFPADPFRDSVYLLRSNETNPPGAEWYASPDTDGFGRPQSWMLKVSKQDLDRLVKVAVSATWNGFDLGIVQYHDGLVHARVSVNQGQKDKVSRGEIPEIVMHGFGEYVGTFRWEDLEDIQMVEKDLKK